MKKILFVILIITALTGLLSADTITVLQIDGMIAGGYLSYLERELQEAEAKGSHACIILLNTPGGLVDTTIKLNELILNAELPVIVFVYPSGGMAASAGAFIVLASDIAAMAPVTTIGAAQPISITPEGAEEAGEKTRNFLARQARSLAERQDRPVDIASDFVERNLALTATESLEEGVIEYIADSVEDLLQQVHGVSVEKKGVTYVLDTETYTLEYPGLKRQEAMQQFFSDPQIAMIFLMLGLMGLYVGFSAPGTLVPEILGGICLILGIYGLGLFETNIVGIILLLAGLGLLVAEFFTSGFGILGIGGIISLIIGGLLLPLEPLMGADWYGGFMRTVIGLGVGVGIILIFVVHRVIKSLRNPRTEDINLAIPDEGLVVEKLQPEGIVKAKGELWKAKSVDGSTIDEQEEVNVVGKKSGYLLVNNKKKSKEP